MAAPIKSTALDDAITLLNLEGMPLSPISISPSIGMCLGAIISPVILYDATSHYIDLQGAVHFMTISPSPEPISPSELNDPLSGSLCHELRKTSVTVLAAMASEFGKWQLKPSEAALLKYVGANPGCTQSDIARAFRNKATNLVSLIARLERDGLLERAPGDGRAIALSITARGDAVLAGIDASYERLEEKLSEHLTTEQRRLTIDALRIICKSACHYDKS